MSDQSLTTAELCEWLANPQWTNGRLNQEDAVVHMMLAADTIAAKDARITELEAELVFVWGQLEVALGTIKIQRCSVDAILSAVGDDSRVANLRASLVEKTSAPAPTTGESR